MPSPLDEPESTPPPLQSDQVDESAPKTTNNPDPLAIDYPSAGTAQEVPDEPIQSLDLGQGNVVKLDRLGPMIVNTDGTLSRISNWHELSEMEQERTVRLLVKKRNLVRLEKLDEQERAEGRGEGEGLTALMQGKEGGNS